MGEGIKQGFEIIDRLAHESGHPKAFFSGVVVGLGHAKGFLTDPTLDTEAAIEVFLNMIDARYFKGQEI